MFGMPSTNSLVLHSSQAKRMCTALGTALRNGNLHLYNILFRNTGLPSILLCPNVHATATQC